jgi:hypothetical protein
MACHFIPDEFAREANVFRVRTLAAEIGVFLALSSVHTEEVPVET